MTFFNDATRLDAPSKDNEVLRGGVREQWKTADGTLIPYRRLAGYPTISRDNIEKGVTITQGYVVRTSDVGRVLNDHIGTLYWYPNGVQARPKPRMFLSGSHPDSDSVGPPRNNLYLGLSNDLQDHLETLGPASANSVTVTPFSSDLVSDPLYTDTRDFNTVGRGPTEKYDALSKVVVTYVPNREMNNHWKGDFPTDFETNNTYGNITFADVKARAGGQYLIIPNQNLRSVPNSQQSDTPEPVDARTVGLTLRESLIEYDVTCEFVEDLDLKLGPPWTQIINLLGHVNNSATNTPVPAPAGTLLFLGLSADRRIGLRAEEGSDLFVTCQSTAYWRLVYKFAYRGFTVTQDGADYLVTWQHIWRPSEQRYEVVYRNVRDDRTSADEPGELAFLYTYGDFDSLFTHWERLNAF